MDEYTVWTTVTLRFGDTDALGHVNNAVFTTLLESGRIELMQDSEGWFEGSTRYWVIANLNVDFRAEIWYPGSVRVGSAIEGFGRSSMKLRQAIYQGERCCATSHSTVVLIDRSTKKGTPIDEALRKRIEKAANHKSVTEQCK
jgi:acyl-CoA thioester hydrolase